MSYGRRDRNRSLFSLVYRPGEGTDNEAWILRERSGIRHCLWERSHDVHSNGSPRMAGQQAVDTSSFVGSFILRYVALAMSVQMGTKNVGDSPSPNRTKRAKARC